MKMKKLISAMLALVMVLGLAACGSNNPGGSPSSAPGSNASQPAGNEGNSSGNPTYTFKLSHCMR